MKDHLIQMTYEVELEPGEKLTLPPALVDSIGPGHWTITVQPTSLVPTAIRGHSAFLNSYAPADEGLYDDCPAG